MHCPTCEGSPELEAGQIEETVKVGECIFTGTVSSYVCPQCKTQHYTAAPEMHQFELKIASYLAYIGKPTGEMVAFIQKALGYSASELSKLLDISPEHLSRMEHNKRDIERKIFAVLGSLAIDARDGKSETLIRLQKLALGHSCPATVKVEP